jgi:hypothetical protein
LEKREGKKGSGKKGGEAEVWMGKEWIRGQDHQRKRKNGSPRKRNNGRN